MNIFWFFRSTVLHRNSFVTFKSGPWTRILAGPAIPNCVAPLPTTCCALAGWMSVVAINATVMLVAHSSTTEWLLESDPGERAALCRVTLALTPACLCLPTGSRLTLNFLIFVGRSINLILFQFIGTLFCIRFSILIRYIYVVFLLKWMFH